MFLNLSIQQTKNSLALKLKLYVITIVNHQFLRTYILRIMIQDFAKPIRGTQNTKRAYPHGMLKYFFLVIGLSVIFSASFYAFQNWTH